MAAYRLSTNNGSRRLEYHASTLVFKMASHLISDCAVEFFVHIGECKAAGLFDIPALEAAAIAGQAASNEYISRGV